MARLRHALDRDGDQVISTAEIATAGAALLQLDVDGNQRLDEQESHGGRFSIPARVRLDLVFNFHLFFAEYDGNQRQEYKNT